jgi:hypothetical protein
MGDSMHKQKTFTKPFIPQRDKDQRNPQRDWKGKTKLDDETRKELMRKKLCFTCRYQVWRKFGAATLVTGFDEFYPFTSKFTELHASPNLFV